MTPSRRAPGPGPATGPAATHPAPPREDVMTEAEPVAAERMLARRAEQVSAELAAQEPAGNAA